MTLKFSNLLKYLLAPFFVFAADADGGGGAADDYGNTLAGDAPEIEVKDPLADPLKSEVAEELTETEEELDGGAAEDKAGKKDSRIPLARHKAMMDKGRAERDALAAQLAAYQKGTQIAQTNEAIDATETKLVAMEGEYNKLLADGEIEKASAKMTEIRRLERTVGEQKSAMAAQASEARAVERVRYDTVVERLEAAYPALNQDSDDFDQEKTTEVLSLKRAFEKDDMTPSAALQKAVKYVFGAEGGKQEKATEVTPNVAKEDVAKLRKQEAIKRNIDAANKTPANLAKAGTNNEDGGELTADKAMKMNQEEFAKLDEKTLARLRGDDL